LILVLVIYDFYCKSNSFKTAFVRKPRSKSVLKTSTEPTLSRFQPFTTCLSPSLACLSCPQPACFHHLPLLTVHNLPVFQSLLTQLSTTCLFLSVICLSQPYTTCMPFSLASLNCPQPACFHHLPLLAVHNLPVFQSRLTQLSTTCLFLIIGLS